MKYLVRIYREIEIDICDEFDSLEEAEEFAETHERYAIFELVRRHEPDTEEKE